MNIKREFQNTSLTNEPFFEVILEFKNEIRILNKDGLKTHAVPSWKSNLVLITVLIAKTAIAPFKL